MKFFLTVILLTINAYFIIPNVYSQEAEKKEIQVEMQKLLKLKEEVQKLIAQKEELLKKLQEEREKLKEEREALKRELEEAESQRYKKLARIFEKMDPELAGEKISSMTDPKKAALIIYNMKPRVAGQVLNYVNPEMVNKIVAELTKIKSSQKSQ